MKFPIFLLCAAAFAQPNTVPIDNNLVKVLVVTQAAGAKSKLHEHTVNRVMIYPTAGGQTLRFEDGHVETQKWTAGGVGWSPAGGKHISENPSKIDNRLIEVELKKPAPASPTVFSAMDPVKLAPGNYKVELENAQVRILRVKLGPKQSVPMHEHGLPRVVVYLTDQEVKVTGEDGKVEMARHKAGEMSYGGKAKHKEENLSGKAFEVLVVEVK
jgi:uncharacterized RmlC-like cupin family protein